MNNKINGRTPEEIKNGLECCIAHTSCDMCPYLGTNNCMAVNTADALAYIQQLERERDEARRDADKLKHAAKEATDNYFVMLRERDELLQKNQQLERERDAAVEGLTIIANNTGSCIMCKHRIHPGYVCDRFEREENCYEWRGVQNEVE